MSTIAFWQPGKTYQLNNVVQANFQGAVTQDDPDNPGFESGDVNWTKDAGWTIAATDPFQGTFSAGYAGVSGNGLIMSALVGAQQEAHKTYNGTTFVQNNITNCQWVAANDSVAVAVNKSNASVAAFRSVDGETWTAAGTIPWTGGDFSMIWLTWLENAGVFVAVQLVGQTYYTSPDGNVWTKRTVPFSQSWGAARFWDAHGKSYVLTSNRNVYSTVDGITWTLVAASVLASAPQLVLFDGVRAVAIIGGGGIYEVWTSLDFITWTENVTGGANLTAAVGTVPDIESMAYNAGTYVFLVHNTTNGATTDETLTSTDLTVWTARSGRAGSWVRWSSKLGKFVSTVGGLAASNGILNTSADGITWAQQVYETGGGYVEYPTADLTAADPIRNMVNSLKAPVVPGQVVRVRAVGKTSALGGILVGLRWFTDVDAVIKTDYGIPITGASTVWREAFAQATAPATAAKVSVVVAGQGPGAVRADSVVWEYFSQVAKSGLIFRATTAPGVSGTAEPTWPTTVSGTVVDNTVTWTAVAANCIVWQAFPILESGLTEPVFAEELDGSTVDNTIRWITEDRRIKDENCPNTKYVILGASKVFAGDGDIIPFSATVNPLDWTTANDAGFIPFGLNAYGSQPLTALGLYRSNLVAFNSEAFQMWQIDEDPANMAILDAVPIGCPFYKSLSPVSNDLVFATSQGIRSMGIAGGSTNLQAGVFGKQIDPLVKAQLDAITDDDNIISLYYPGAGQYWLIFDDEAFVLTMNGGKEDMSWSRYTFPSAITAWTILGKDLYLRSGNKVWRFDEDALVDDAGGTNTLFTGRMWWPYLDFGSIGQDKALVGFDTIADGSYSVSFGYNQGNIADATTPFAIANGDTVTGDIVPYELVAPSIQMRLTFSGDQAWEWSASKLYLQDWRKG